MRTELNKLSLLFLLFSILISVSCKKNVAHTGIKNPANFSEVFEHFWNAMNRNYVYWDMDTVNWNAAYNQYKSYFDNLDINNPNDVRKSVACFKQMTAGLIDGHYSIKFLNPAIADSSFYPSLERKQKTGRFHYPYSYFTVDTHYLDKNFILGFNNNFSTGGVPLTALAGTINQSILYFSCNRFDLLKSYVSPVPNDIQPVLQYFLNKVKNSSVDTKGIIIDVRSNQGGDLSDLNFILGNFVDKPLHFGYTRSKSGNGRLDYTPWIKAYINPEPGAKRVTVPVIVLADNISASLSEAAVMAIHSLPNGIFVGETTWGATGALTDEVVYNAGSFTIDNFLSVQTSSLQFKYLDGKNYEGKGFPPDVLVPFDLTALQRDVDPQLEKAISLIQ